MEHLRVSQHGPILLVELARRETGNALQASLIEELTATVAGAATRPARALILTGSGRAFCAGAHLGELADLGDASHAELVADASRLAALYAALLRCPLLTAAAVNGAAYGGGVGLAAACDLVIAAPTARFQFSEVRLGFVPALISVFLQRRMPTARLATLFLDPQPLSAAEAAELGLVDEVAEDARHRAHERALEVARKAAASAIAETKRLLLALSLPQLDQQLAHAAEVNATQRAHEECHRGVASFLEKRTFPRWLDE